MTCFLSNTHQNHILCDFVHACIYCLCIYVCAVGNTIDTTGNNKEAQTQSDPNITTQQQRTSGTLGTPQESNHFTQSLKSINFIKVLSNKTSSKNMGSTLGTDLPTISHHQSGMVSCNVASTLVDYDLNHTIPNRYCCEKFHICWNKHISSKSRKHISRDLNACDIANELYSNQFLFLLTAILAVFAETFRLTSFLRISNNLFDLFWGYEVVLIV